MPATGQDVSSQIAATANPPVTWAQIMQQVIPPPLPSQAAPANSDDDSTDQTQDTSQEATPPDASQQGSLTPSQVKALGPPPTPPKLSSIGAPTREQQSMMDAILAAEQRSEAEEEEQLHTTIADLKTTEQEEEGITQAEIENLEQAPPAPPTQTANPLQRMAPLLMIAALGGKAAKLDANAMLGATMGTVQGYLSGNQQAYENSVKTYDEAYKRFQERQKTQEQVFEKMREAYKGRADADQKALEAAHAVTGDERAITKDALEAQEHLQKAAQTVAKTQYEMDRGNYHDRAQIAMAQKKAQAAQGVPKPPVGYEYQIDPATRKPVRDASGQPILKPIPGGPAAVAADKRQQSGQQQQQLIDRMDHQIDQITATIKANPGVTTGVPGMLTRAEQVVKGHLGMAESTAATDLKAQAEQLSVLLAQYDKSGGHPSTFLIKMVQDISGGTTPLSDDANTLSRLAQLRALLNDERTNASGTASPTVTNTKTIGGVTYVQRNGQWYAQ